MARVHVSDMGICLEPKNPSETHRKAFYVNSLSSNQHEGKMSEHISEHHTGLSTPVEVHSLAQRKIRLTQSNIECGDISLWPIFDFFQPEVVGGFDPHNAAAAKITLIFDWDSFESDIDGSQWKFRDRDSLVDLLTLNGASAGDDLVVDQISLYVYFCRIERESAPTPAAQT